jgi:transcriptional regulator with XRE-family HTH domain
VWADVDSAQQSDVTDHAQNDIIYDINNPAELIRSTRERLGLSQRRLALRAGTTQAAISRIERGLVSPTYTTLRELMLAMGEEPVLDSRRLPTNWDPAHMASTLARTPEERLALALSWNKMAGSLTEAGRQARADG